MKSRPKLTMPRVWHIILMTMLMATGCGYSLRLSGGPSVDTVGRNGFDIRVELSFGPGDARGNCTTGFYVGGGSLGEDSEGAMVPYGWLLGCEGLVGDWSPNAAMVLGGRDTYGDDETHTGGIGLQLGLGYALSSRSSITPILRMRRGSALVTGLQVRMEYLWSGDDRGLFTFPLYLEVFGGG